MIFIIVLAYFILGIIISGVFMEYGQVGQGAAWALFFCMILWPVFMFGAIGMWIGSLLTRITDVR